MSMDKFDSNWFKILIENAGYEVRSYSGRGMYGKQCLGVEIDRDVSLGKFFADVFGEGKYVGNEQFETVQEAFNSMKTDSMGLGQIVYFEDVQWTDDDTDFEEADEENPEEAQTT